MIVDGGISDIIFVIIREGFWWWVFTPKRRGKIRDAYTRVERIERIHDWRDAHIKNQTLKRKP